jgi:CheY-like chemotaxis protein
MKLVLVEDNADLALSMRMLLEMRGYEVRHFLSGQDFLAHCTALDEGDVIITDYYLPDFNGIELVRRARALRPNVKAIVLTGSREKGIAQAARAMRGCRLEHKPLDYEALDRSIREVQKR